MPDPNWVWNAFDRSTVNRVVPRQSGVYMLARYDVLWDRSQFTYVYAGRATGQDGLQGRLLEHVNGENFLIAAAGPTHFAFVPLDARSASEVEAAWLQQFSTECNRRRE